MSTHPSYYTDLVQRWFRDDPSLMPRERQELDLHLLICPQCSYDYAWLLRSQAPEKSEALLRSLEGTLTAELVTPYLRDLVWTVHAGQPLTGFQCLLWQFVHRDREALGRFRLLEADVYLHGGR